MQVEDAASIAPAEGHGVSAVDYDADGDIDFFLSTDQGIPNRLYQNQGDGTFVDVAEQAGLASVSCAQASLWFDYNRDQRLDLVVLGDRCIHQPCNSPFTLQLYQQTPEGKFINTTDASGLRFGQKYDNLDHHAVGGLAAADLNQDGVLDLLITVWGGSMTLFLNNSDGTFTDASIAAGFAHHKAKYYQPLLMDFDGDARVDVYCNVDFDANQLWMNQGQGKFSLVEEKTALSTIRNEMGITAADYDNDGDIDIYATAISQSSFYRNVLMRNLSAGEDVFFREVATPMGVAQSGWDWGTTFFDANNDGWLDLVVTNGWTFTDKVWPRDSSRLWLNQQNGRFEDHSDNTGINDTLEATTIIAFDADRDGDLDLLQSLKANEETRKPIQFYQNQLSDLKNKGNYLVVKPRMAGDNHFAIGAVVRVYSGGKTMTRLITAGTSFYGQEPAEAFFGLGQQPVADRIEIVWPGGIKSDWYDVKANQVLVFTPENSLNKPTAPQLIEKDKSLVFSWIDNSDKEAGFLVRKSETPRFTEVKDYILPPNTSVFEDFIASEEIWYYKVRAFDNQASSAFTKILSGKNVIAGKEDIRTTPTPLILFPNPVKASGRLQLEMSNSYRGVMGIVIVNQTGQIISRQQVRKSGDWTFLYIEAPHTPGLYFLHIEEKSKNLIRKIVVCP